VFGGVGTTGNDSSGGEPEANVERNRNPKTDGAMILVELVLVGNDVSGVGLIGSERDWEDRERKRARKCSKNNEEDGL
jgi:hypothetical protein